MKIFPRDPVRRAQWAANVNRKEWIPTERSFLCEVHFAHDMWENNRVDGKRKLKINAVPTIFGSKAKKIKSHRENMRLLWSF
ncbi:THAP domain-containing protein 2-like [Temnothorax curvispinosus]|uniref:THAP domain-containing protein 2-like n=1 Tax=Temnothorax curvispinosus TaxID=300111 RepID=A0A6J1PUK5_9HYME|nr:THAP domain-containing protein 2-like [Temnothorax curvispinosus]